MSSKNPVSASHEETELPPRRDCPICNHGLPLKRSESAYYQCCGRVICFGCVVGRERAEFKETGYIIEGMTPEEEQFLLISLSNSCVCPFCRHEGPTTDEESVQFLNNRIRARDDRDYTRALTNLGTCYAKGEDGLPQDVDKAEELYKQAFDLDDPHAALCLARLCCFADQQEREVKYLQRGDMLGNVYCTRHLADLAHDSRNFDEMTRFGMKAARMGLGECMEDVFKWYRQGKLSKDDRSTTRRAHQAVNDELKTPGREFAKRFHQFVDDNNLEVFYSRR